MSVRMKARYVGTLRCQLEHEPSSTSLGTDAPKDNLGQGASFSPTDLVGAALLSCAITTMAIRAQREGVPFPGARGEVVKTMTTSAPRRIESLVLHLEMPEGVEPARRAWFELIARTCPVASSLSTEVETEMRFSYPEGA